MNATIEYTDSHIHFYENGKTIPEARLKEILYVYASHNIFTLYDMGHKEGIGIELKKKFEDKLKINTCGFALFKDGGYGSFIGKPIKSKKEIPLIVRYLKKSGVDFIKVINSGIVTTTPNAPISNGGFSYEELKIIVEEAKNYNLKVICHVNGDEKIRQSIKAGVSSIEHGFFISQESILMMKEKKVEWTPTVNALLSITKFLYGDEKNYINSIITDHIEKINIAKQMGIKINVGSDSGSKGIEHVSSFFKELEILNI
jgi:hypothetical protein